MSREPNTIFIGRKPTMNYVLAVITGFNASDTNEVTLKARGQAITTAVDTAEIVNKRFMKDVTVGSIIIGTEEIQREEGQMRNVSTMEIKLTRDSQAKKPKKKRSKTKATATPKEPKATPKEPQK